MFPNSTNYFFRTGEIAFLTKHKKESLVAPILEPFLGARLLHLEGFDTDTLGTFTRDVKRVDSQLETARKKARIGMDLGRTRMGIGSEGSFSTDPYFGFLSWNIEMLVFIDDLHELEIVGVAEGPVKLLQKTGGSIEEIVKLAVEFGFPGNHVILRPDSGESPDFIKDIATLDQLKDGIDRCLGMSRSGLVHIENDLRSHAFPARQEMIKTAVVNLLLKMHSLCPVCNTPGYWVMETKKGLPCVHCRFPTDVLKSQVYSCRACGFSKEIERSDLEFADQGSCNYCNP